MRRELRAYVLVIALLLGIWLMSDRAFSIEQKRATLISYDSIRNVIQLNVDGNVYTARLHQMCVVARQDGTKVDISELLPGLTVKVWVDKIPPTLVYAVQILSAPKMVDPRGARAYPKGVVPDRAPTRGYATYPYEMSKSYYSSPTSNDWEKLSNSYWWPWSFYIAGPVIMDPYGYWWGPLTLFGYYDPLYYYGYYTFDALQKEPNLPEYRYLMAVEDALYREAGEPNREPEKNVISSSPRVAQNFSGNYYSYVPQFLAQYYPMLSQYLPYMGYNPQMMAQMGAPQQVPQTQPYQLASRPDLLAQASQLKGSNSQAPIMQFGPSTGTYKEYDVKLLGVDLSTSKLIVEGAKDTYIFTAQTNFMVKKVGSYKYDVIAIEEATRLAYPTMAHIRGYYINANTFLVTDIVVYQ